MTMIQQPLTGGSFTNWIKLLQENGGVDLKYLPRAAYVSVLSFSGIPNRIFERLRFGELIANSTIEEDPIFIIGHWRSGTTYLHNLMTQDPHLGYISSLQAWCPEMFIASKPITKFMLEKTLPETRPMDNINLSSDAPQEEEYAIGNLSPYCFYHGWYFPKKMKKFFNSYVLFEGVSQQTKANWKKVYLNIIKKANFSMNGKRLVIKNPANTARIKILLDMFPDAKFIHIYRNPYIVYLSTQNMYKKLIETFAFQDISLEEISKNIFVFYKQLMQKFFEEKKLIPPGNLVEIKYEDFEVNQIGELERIYHQLKLPNFEQAKDNFEKYIAAQANYQKNQYTWNEQTSSKIKKYWNFTIEQWNYSIPAYR